MLEGAWGMGWLVFGWLARRELVVANMGHLRVIAVRFCDAFARNILEPWLVFSLAAV
jgi:hypothetical protein